ncbi:MAG: type II toxin-antitoxin system Phd/YefM family antitoxin, partial [bacterium]|nr:type II toxin-antitoxin system Phd/YefM family antitoxin [bacterium]MCY4623334.1 type II toxin-antitoxin system Phd/YefM family antitoxin [bacterium]
MTVDSSHARTIPAGEFKAKCLKLMDEVNETGVPIIITKRGRPVSRLVPADQ